MCVYTRSHTWRRTRRGRKRKENSQRIGFLCWTKNEIMTNEMCLLLAHWLKWVMRERVGEIINYSECQISCKCYGHAVACLLHFVASKIDFIFLGFNLFPLVRLPYAVCKCDRWIALCANTSVAPIEKTRGQPLSSPNGNRYRDHNKCVFTQSLWCRLLKYFDWIWYCTTDAQRAEHGENEEEEEENVHT